LFLTLGATGEARSLGLYDSVREFSFADLKGDLDALGELGGGLEWQEGGAEALNPAKRGRVLLDGNELGSAGLLARRVADKLKFRQDVFLAEIVLGPFLLQVLRREKCAPLPAAAALPRGRARFLPAAE
jgi:phenylalanyl-tRNA synthetase beta subunit